MNSPSSGRSSISSAMRCERSPLATAPITRARFGGRLRQVGDEAVHVLHGVRPGAGDRSERGALLDLAVAPDDDREPRQLGGEPLVHLDHFVEGVGDLARHADPVVGEPRGEIAFADRFEDAQQRRCASSVVGSTIPGAVAMGKHSRSRDGTFDECESGGPRGESGGRSDTPVYDRDEPTRQRDNFPRS